MTPPRRQQKNKKLCRQIGKVKKNQRQAGRIQAQSWPSESHYRIIADNTYDWEFWCDPGGRFLYCSPACEKITGHTAEEFRADPQLRFQLIHPDDRPLFEEHLREVEARRIEGEGEWRFLRPDGSFCWVGHVCQPVFDAEGQYLGCRASNRDITRRKQAEEALRRERSLLESVIKSTDVMLVLLDPKFNFLWVNDAYAKTCGMKPAEMVGQNHFALYSNRDTETVFRQVRDTGEGVFFKDKPFMFPDQPGRGMTYWDWSLLPVKDTLGSVISLVFSLRETTKFIQAKRALHESQERFRALVTASSDVVYQMSPDWSEMLHLVGQGFLANTIAPNANWLQEYIFPEDQPRVMAAINEAIRTKGIFELEHRVRRTDSDAGWVFSRAIPILDSQNEIIEWFGMASDITERKKAEEVLRRDKKTFERLVSERTRELTDAQTTLAAAKRLSEIGTFAATVAHELRTPLSVIRVGAYNLKQKKPHPSLLRHIENIEKKAFESSQIINNLLFYARIKTPAFEKVHLPRPLDECVTAAKGTFDGLSVRIIKKYKRQKLPPLKADPLQLAEVFGNILSNAIESLPGRSGRIEVDAGYKEREQVFFISFKDNGCGISPENLPKIHEPFFTTKSRGTGLGLTVCHQVALNHGGKIDVVSEDGKGALFIITLPLGK